MSRDVVYTFQATDQAGHQTTVNHTVTVSDPVTAWPGLSNTGPRQTTTRTLNGASIADTSWFSANGFTGAGTQANPYLVSRVLFTSGVVLGDWDPTNIGGKYVKFVDCRFYGDPTNPTQGGNFAVGVRDTGPFVTLEYCHIGPNATPLASGGPPASVGGYDKAFQSYVPFTLRRCNVWGAAILVYFEIERPEGPSLVEDCYLHDVWSSGSDHTDSVNGNHRASHVTIKGCEINGIRTGNAKVVNGIGIYNDDSQGNPTQIIEDWHIIGNRLSNCQTGILSTSDTAKFLGPFEVRNNVFAGPFTVQRTAMRAPTAQSGNVDASGNAITL